jgi:hypothetical protein
MARLIPSDLDSVLGPDGMHAGEARTLARLRDGLNDRYTVYHGVHWARAQRGGSAYGEIDFIVLNRAGAVLLIEQKNGLLEESADGLTKHYEDNRKNLANQVHRSIDKVREKFQWQHGRDVRLALDYLVYLPDYRVKNLNAVGLDAQRIVDAPARDLLAERIDRLGVVRVRSRQRGGHRRLVGRPFRRHRRRRRRPWKQCLALSPPIRQQVQLVQNP